MSTLDALCNAEANEYIRCAVVLQERIGRQWQIAWEWLWRSTCAQPTAGPATTDDNVTTTTKEATLPSPKTSGGPDPRQSSRTRPSSPFFTTSNALRIYMTNQFQCRALEWAVPAWVSNASSACVRHRGNAGAEKEDGEISDDDLCSCRPPPQSTTPSLSEQHWMTLHPAAHALGILFVYIETYWRLRTPKSDIVCRLHRLHPTTRHLLQKLPEHLVAPYWSVFADELGHILRPAHEHHLSRSDSAAKHGAADDGGEYGAVCRLADAMYAHVTAGGPPWTDFRIGP